MSTVMILGSGYISQAFQRELTQRDESYWVVSRREIDYTNFYKLQRCIRDFQPEFLINAAGYVGGMNIDGCEQNKAETLLANLALPVVVSNACQITDTPWMHISSGCIFSGAKVNGMIEPDLRKIKKMLETRSREISGFTEEDHPNFCFHSPYANMLYEPCSFYTGVKEAAERALRTDKTALIVRLRMPFDERNHPRNYLTKLSSYERVYDNYNSLSHLGDACSAALDLMCRSETGIYHLTNPGYMSAREITAYIRVLTGKQFKFWDSDAEFYRVAAVAPRSNCILDNCKAMRMGVMRRNINDAILAAIEKVHAIDPVVLDDIKDWEWKKKNEA